MPFWMQVLGLLSLSIILLPVEIVIPILTGLVFEAIRAASQAYVMYSFSKFFQLGFSRVLTRKPPAHKGLAQLVIAPLTNMERNLWLCLYLEGGVSLLYTWDNEWMRKHTTNPALNCLPLVDLLSATIKEQQHTLVSPVECIILQTQLLPMLACG